jgi:hypothetical protein
MTRLQLTIDTQLAIMAKYGLTAEEWFTTELLFLATESNGSPAYLYKYFLECKKDAMPAEILKSLQDKGVLSKDYRIPGKGEAFDPEEVEWSKSFENNYFKMADVAGNELFDAYPGYLQGTEGRLLPAKNITTKGFLSLEAFFHHYAKSIRHSPKRHAEVMDILNWAIKNELITYTIAEYVITRKWQDHMKMREEGQIGKMPVKMGTLEQL